MADFIDRKALRARMRAIMDDGITVDHSESSPTGIKIDESVFDLIIDAVVDAHAQAAVSKGMDFARGLLAKRGGKDSDQ